MSDQEKDLETINPTTEAELPESFRIGTIEVNKISEKGKKSIKTRVLVALLLIAIALPCLVLGSWAWFALVTVAGAMAGYEIVRAPQKKPRWYIYLLVYVFLFLTIYWTFFRNYGNRLVSQYETVGYIKDFSFSLEGDYPTNGYGMKGSMVSISPIILGAMLIAFFWLSIAQETFSFTDICYYFTMVTLVGLGFQSALYLRYIPFSSYPTALRWGVDDPAFRFFQSLTLVVFPLLGALLNDTFAYFGGMLFGRHHMNPRVSPKKTWEGFFIGWGLTSACLCAYGLVLSNFGIDMLPGIFDLEHWYLIVIVSLIVPVLGDLGDLSFSLIKRHFGFKDYSHVLGPHGGVLDRVDSCIFTVLGVAVFVMVCIYWMPYQAPASQSEAVSSLGLLL
jgi:CDP-diglyceride synthetase